MHSHGIIYDLLHRAFDIVHALGLPLAILAWVTIVTAVAGMALLLRRTSRPGIWRPSIIVGLLALAGHAADIGATLIVSPDLSLEANPMWRAVADSCGLAAANLHALTGQLMVIVLSAQLFAWYLLTRDRLAPAGACTFPQFVLQLGAHTPRRFGVRLLPLASPSGRPGDRAVSTRCAMLERCGSCRRFIVQASPRLTAASSQLFVTVIFMLVFCPF